MFDISTPESNAAQDGLKELISAEAELLAEAPAINSLHRQFGIVAMNNGVVSVRGQIFKACPAGTVLMGRLIDLQGEAVPVSAIARTMPVDFSDPQFCLRIMTTMGERLTTQFGDMVKIQITPQNLKGLNTFEEISARERDPIVQMVNKGPA